MATPDVQSASPPRKRRWYQFSLRTLMIVMLLASIGLSWFAVKLQQARRQRMAVAAIREAGGAVIYDYVADAEPPGPNWLREVLGVDFFAKPLFASIGSEGDVCLKQIAAFPDLEYLNLCYSTVTDEGLAHLPQLLRLEALDLSRTSITDEGLAHLAKLSRLKELKLTSIAITDKGLAHLARLSQLEGIDLTDNEITDDGLAHLAQLPQLQGLSLINTPITNAGLEHLKRLNRLQELNLSGTRVTAEGVAELRRALPGCYIEGP